MGRVEISSIVKDKRERKKKERKDGSRARWVSDCGAENGTSSIKRRHPDLGLSSSSETYFESWSVRSLPRMTIECFGYGSSRLWSSKRPVIVRTPHRRLPFSPTWILRRDQSHETQSGTRSTVPSSCGGWMMTSCRLRTVGFSSWPIFVEQTRD